MIFHLSALSIVLIIAFRTPLPSSLHLSYPLHRF